MKPAFFYATLLLLLCIGCTSEETPYKPIELNSFLTESRIVVVKDSIVDNSVFSSDTIQVRYYDIARRQVGYDLYKKGAIEMEAKYNYIDSSCSIDLIWAPEYLDEHKYTHYKYDIYKNGFHRIAIHHPGDTSSILDFTMNNDFKITRITGLKYLDSNKRDVDQYYEYDKHGNLQRFGSNPNLVNNTSVSRNLPITENYVNSYRGDTLIKQEMRKGGRTEHFTTYEYHGDTLIESHLNAYGRLETKTYKSLKESYFYIYVNQERIFKIEYYKNGFFIGRDNYLREQVRHDP